jgi:hypothetical protein
MKKYTPDEVMTQVYWGKWRGPSLLIAADEDQRFEWRWFETAPKDGTEIIVYRVDAGVFTAAFIPPEMPHGFDADEDDWCWFSASGEDLTGDLPTHWMPLPVPPK